MWFESSFRIRTVAAISLGLIGGTTPIYADLGDQLAKLRANDGAKGDNFGVSVAMSGTTVIVGARGNDDNGGASGSAYLLDAGGAPGNCPWDIDGNGTVGATDLLALLVSWGGCDDCSDCPADFDSYNCVVGATDLLALLVHWGRCP